MAVLEKHNTLKTKYEKYGNKKYNKDATIQVS
jgi:hypothetical protein